MNFFELPEHSENLTYCGYGFLRTNYVVFNSWYGEYLNGVLHFYVFVTLLPIYKAYIRVESTTIYASRFYRELIIQNEQKSLFGTELTINFQLCKKLKHEQLLTDCPLDKIKTAMTFVPSMIWMN